MIQINYRDPRPIYEQVKDGFRKLILTEVLRPEERLPSVRELATESGNQIVAKQAPGYS